MKHYQILLFVLLRCAFVSFFALHLSLSFFLLNGFRVYRVHAVHSYVCGPPLRRRTGSVFITCSSLHDCRLQQLRFFSVFSITAIYTNTHTHTHMTHTHMRHTHTTYSHLVRVGDSLSLFYFFCRRQYSFRITFYLFVVASPCRGMKKKIFFGFFFGWTYFCVAHFTFLCFCVSWNVYVIKSFSGDHSPILLQSRSQWGEKMERKKPEEHYHFLSICMRNKTSEFKHHHKRD